MSLCTRASFPPLLGLCLVPLIAACPEPEPEGEDAGSTGSDAATADAAIADTAGSDLARPDVGAGDSGPTDQARPDTAGGDITSSDLVQPDVGQPDVGSGPYIQVLSPNGGESWGVGSPHAITWEAEPGSGDVYLQYSKDNFVADITTITTGVSDTGRHVWDPVPIDLSDTVRVRAGLVDHPGVFDSSDADFSLREGGWARHWDDYDHPSFPAVAVDSQRAVLVARAGQCPGGTTGLSILKLDQWGEPVWERCIEGPVYPLDLDVDPMDRLYILGRFEAPATVDFDPGTSVHEHTAGGNDTFVLRIEDNGDFALFFHMTGSLTATGIAAVGLVGFAVGGYFIGDVDLDPSAVGGELSTLGGNDAFLALWGGTVLDWAVRWGGASHDMVLDVAVDSRNKILAGGTFRGTDVDFQPERGTDLRSAPGDSAFFAVRYDRDGSYEGAHTFGWSGSGSFDAIAVDSSDRPYFVGGGVGQPGEALSVATTAGPVTLTHQGASDVVVVRHDLDFAVDMVSSFGAEGHDEFEVVAFGPSDELVATVGTSSAALDLHPDPQRGELNTSEVSLAVFDSSMEYQRHRAIPVDSEYRVGLGIDDLGYIYLADNVSWDVTELAPIEAPCLSVAVPVDPDVASDFLIKYTPELCW